MKYFDENILSGLAYVERSSGDTELLYKTFNSPGFICCMERSPETLKSILNTWLKSLKTRI